MFLRQCLTIAAKDLRAEWRTKEALNASLAFSSGDADPVQLQPSIPNRWPINFQEACCGWYSASPEH